jgi:hypothetical protein
MACFCFTCSVLNDEAHLHLTLLPSLFVCLPPAHMQGLELLLSLAQESKQRSYSGVAFTRSAALLHLEYALRAFCTADRLPLTFCYCHVTAMLLPCALLSCHTCNIRVPAHLAIDILIIHPSDHVDIFALSDEILSFLHIVTG